MTNAANPKIPTQAQLPIGHATLEYVPPSSPPKEGSYWDKEDDFPGIKLTVYLPGEPKTPRRELVRELRHPGNVLMGEEMNSDWGHIDVASNARFLSCIFRNAELAAAEEYAELAAAGVAATLTAVLGARSARLAEREATIAAAHARHGRVLPPK